MVRTIFFALVLLLTLTGLAGILYYIMLKLMTPGGEGRAELTVYIEPGEEDVDLLVRGAQFRATLLGDRFYRDVMVVDRSGDRDTGELCRLLCRELHIKYEAAEGADIK